MYPIIEYAKKIGKNTAEFTASDLSRFTRWWMKKPLDAEVLLTKRRIVTPEQRIIYEEDKKRVQEYYKRNPAALKDITERLAKLGISMKGIQNMGKVVHKSKVQQVVEEAVEEAVEETIEEMEQDGDFEVVEMGEDAEEDTQEQTEEPTEEVVAELGVTKKDVEALKWAIGQVFADYDMDSHEYQKPLDDLLAVLSSIE